MAKKSNEAKRIAAKIDSEYGKLAARVAPKMQRRARGRLHRLKRVMSRMKPLKVKEHYTTMAERDMRASIAKVKGQISAAKSKAVADKARIASLSREMWRLKREVPQLNSKVRSWSSAERAWTRKHRSVWRNLAIVKRMIAREEKRQAKLVNSLKKYFK